MAELLSLKELKAQNAASDEDSKDLPVEDKKEIIEDEYIETNESVEATTDKVDSEDEELTKAEVESWMQPDEAETSDDDLKSGFVPNHEAANRRKKAKALKGELSEAKDENEDLKARIAALESGNAPVAQVVESLPPRPTREQHDYDDDAYDAAIDVWNDKKFDLKLKSHSQANQNESNQQRQQQDAQTIRNKGLDDHYDRAQKLVDDGKVTQEAYKSADTIVRRTLDAMMPNLTDTLISTLNSAGNGSEKVMFQLGVNPAKLQELQSKLAADPSGLSASLFLGQLQSQIQTPSKRRSQAPKPGAKVDGEGGAGGKFGTLQKQYNKLTEPQDRISFKRKAKKDGVDTNNW